MSSADNISSDYDTSKSATQPWGSGPGEKLDVRPPAMPYDAEEVGEMTETERRGHAKYSRLGWKRLTIVLIVEAIALGSLSLPSTFATLGMVAGVICSVGVGLIAIYTSYVVGQVKVKYPQCATYPDAGRLMFGTFGYELINVMLILTLVFLVGSHCLTGTIAWMDITSSGACSVGWAALSAVILFFVALPPSFTETAILGYIDFASIVIAIGITIIGTGVEASNQPGGLSAVNWSAWPAADTNFATGFIAVSNIVFAYSFAMCQFSFMDEMHTPTDFPKSIWALGLIEIVIYTITGALIYAFVGADVQSPALLSAGTTLSKVAFGVALPVIFISGSINGTVACRIIHGRIFKNSEIRFVNTKMGWITWIALMAVITIVAFIVAEVIPIFEDLLSIMSALFISGFTFYFPALMWFMLIKEGPWYSAKNLPWALLNVLTFLMGILTLGAGTYSSIWDIIQSYKDGSVNGVFSCAMPA